jgi:hypothetical protein
MVVAVNYSDSIAVTDNRRLRVEFCKQGRMFWWLRIRRGPGNRLSNKGGIMIDSNQNEFAGAMPVSESPANWNWMKERVQSCELENLHVWMRDQLLAIEDNYAGWVTEKSRQLALQGVLRDSRS